MTLEKIIEDGKFVGAIISRGGLIVVLVISLLTISILSGTIVYILHNFTDRYTGSVATSDWKGHQKQHTYEWENHSEDVKDIVTSEKAVVNKDITSITEAIKDMQDDMETMKTLVIRMDANQRLILKELSMNGGDG